ncbi:MAG: homoserine kinase [Anaerolineae bacterium]|nr:homoserine kinase [Anaerolineae bacterium]
MRKARVTVPAVCTNLGPGVHSLALALGLHLTVAFVERSDSRLLIETHGEGAADLPSDCYHPVMFAAIRVFQQVEDAPLGLRIDVRNNIPLESGLGAAEAMTLAGLIGANNLMGMPLSRDELIMLGAEILGRADGLVAGMLGGLTACALDESGAVYRRIDLSPLKVLVVVPQLDDYDSALARPPQNVPLERALANIGRQALLVEALREGDAALLGRMLNDAVLDPALGAQIPGYAQAVEAALGAGAQGVTISGSGPGLVVFALHNHYRIADAIQRVFDARGTLSRVWTLPVDTQGVVVTAAELNPD